ncbi:TonB-dependent receptor plug domain-containing protein [Colwellia sp. 20A7]|uniref:TonB-dependent receptor plug domain-containing protein n=1 Tax=Colwellia sp. 20A7 TaxID=2689569 RepID=UPI00135A9208|nr:TonB-dependent receptor [Colwellia sp. 20A7]
MSTKFRATTLALAVSVALGTAPSYAAEKADSVKEEKVERIAVVGSRGAPRSVNDSPVPIDIIGGDELAKGGNTDMLELLKGSVPSLNVHSNPISDAASLVKPANLRGLSSDSTLILVNGKRRHRASVIALLGGGINDGAQGPDISVIPSSALKQVEVLRDGAAAQYGSDAIAGVMNFVLKDDSDGGSLTVRAGSYYEGDGDTLEVSGNIGMELTKDGFINASFQYKNSDATSRSVQRTDAAAFDAVGVEGIENPAQVWGSPKVEDDYTIFINSGLDLGDNKEAYMFGNFSERDVRGGFYYRNPHTRGGVYSNGDTDEDGDPNLLIADLDGIGVGGSCSPVNITTDNVLTQDDYINNVVNDANCFSFNEMLPGGFIPNFGGNIVDTSLTMGTRGELDNGVMYDVSGSVGMNESSYVIYDTLNASLGPVTGRDFSPGKHRQLEKTFNLDFNKELELDAIDYLMVAAGYEWHAESFEVTAGDVDSYIAGPYTDQGFGIGSNGFPGFKPESAGVFSRQNFAFYVDVEAQITEDLLIGTALRYEDYSSFGDDTNYKVTAQYNVTEDFSLRGSISTGFRAPTVGQANYSNVQTSLDGGVLSDSALLPATNPVAQQLGATELTPEESESYTLGAVWNIGDVFITLDYYNIQVEDRISQSDKYNLTEDDKAALTLAGVANVDSIQQVSFFTNDFDTTTQGIDLIANYSTELLEGDSVFSFAYNYNETKVDSYSEVTGDFKVSRLENDLPNHRATLTWSQSYDDFSFFVRGNYYGEYQGVHVDYDATIGDGDAALLFDAEASYFINDSFTVAVGAQNIFDEQATKINRQDGGDNSAWGGVYYETSPFGFNGGYYYVKATYNF